MRHRLQLSRKALFFTLLIALATVAASLGAAMIFGKYSVGMAVMGVFVGLTMGGLSLRQKGVVLLLATLLTGAATLAGDNWAVMILLLLASVGTSVMTDSWVQGAARLLPAMVAYAMVGISTPSALGISGATAMGILVASVLLLWVGADKAPRRATVNPQHVIPMLVFVLLTLFFTLEAARNGWQHGYWMVVALCSVLQFRETKGSTQRRIVEQIIGTAIGAIVAIFIAAYLPAAVSACMLVLLLVAAIYFNLTAQRQHAALATTTGLILLLPAVSSNTTVDLAEERLAFIIGGLAIISIVSWLAWRFEPVRQKA